MGLKHVVNIYRDLTQLIFVQITRMLQRRHLLSNCRLPKDANYVV